MSSILKCTYCHGGGGGGISPSDESCITSCDGGGGGDAPAVTNSAVKFCGRKVLSLNFAGGKKT